MVREHGVVRRGSVTFAEDEPVALLPSRVRRVEPDHAVVQDVDRVERGGRALLVLLVPDRERHQAMDLARMLGRHPVHWSIYRSIYRFPPI